MTYALEVIELAGGVPALHPERKGQLNRSKLKNWVEKNGGLPPYINSVATALLRDHPEWPISRVIATAVNWAKKTCATGRAFGGKVKVSSAVQKAACNAVKQWEAKKAAASVEFDEFLLQLSSEEFKEEQWEARIRKQFRAQGEVPDLINMSDELYLRFLESEDKTNLVELSWDFEEEVNMDNIDAFMQVMELSAGAQAAVMTPINMSRAEKVGKGRYRKEILKTGEIVVDKTGRTFNFTSDFLKGVYQNFSENNPLDYVPFLFTDEKDRHTMTANPNTYGGKVVALSLDDPENPTKLYGEFDLTEDTEKVVQHNPNYGVSVTAHPNFIDAPRNKYVGPMLLNVAATHYPKMTKMGQWEKVGVELSSEHHDYQVINMSMGHYINDEQEETNNDRGGDDMSDDKTLNLSSEQLAELLQSDAVQAAIAGQVQTAVKEKDDQIVELSNQLGTIKKNSYEQLVDAAFAKYPEKGVPPAMVDIGKALLLSLGEDKGNEVLELSTGSGDQKKELKGSIVEMVGKLMDEAQGLVDLSSEQGSEENNDEQISTEKRQAGTNWLLEAVGHAPQPQS